MQKWAAIRRLGMKREQGFGLLEMLISTTLFLVLLAAILSSLNDALGLNQKTSQMADLEQNMRAGMNFMVQDFIQSGWEIPTGGIAIPAGAGAMAVKRPGPPGTNYNFPCPDTISGKPGRRPGSHRGGRGNGHGKHSVCGQLVAAEPKPACCDRRRRFHHDSECRHANQLVSPTRSV